jgi:riboflavin kinase/FMN adenylyltransferase
MKVISIGNFDGVHLGHQALMSRARELAGAGQVVAVTFEPHPAVILRPDTAPVRLTGAHRRRELLLEAGADEVRELKPTPELLAMDAEEFIFRLLEDGVFDAVVEGPDFRFARRRSAGIDVLREIGSRRGFKAEVIQPQLVTLEDQSEVQVSSSLVRWLLQHGRVVDAATTLGRPYRLAGTVVSGDQRGRTLGFPTANLDHGNLLLPADGVYAGLAHLPEGGTRPAAVSIGTKPTFGTSVRIAEIHLIGHDAPVDDYGWRLRVDLLKWLRDQTRFDDIDDLLKRIALDCEETSHCVQEHSVP